MKSFSKILISLLLILTLSTSALAEGIFDGQPYFGLSGMLAGAKNSRVDDFTGSPDPVFTTGAEVITNVGYGVSGSVGWLFDSNWRIELELSRRAITLDHIAGPAGTTTLDGDLVINAAFVNIAKDFRSKALITPYVGVGLGGSIHELDLERVGPNIGLSKRTPTTLAFQALFGVQLEVSDDMDILVGYRYVNYYAPDYTEFSYDFVDFHNFEVGIKFYTEDW